jgi:hypothetical protein
MIPTLLAQVDPSTVANGLSKDLNTALAWGLALALLAIAYLFKSQNDERKEYAKALEAAQTKLVETIRADAKEQREILSQIVPLSTKLTEGLEILERVTDTLTRE